MVEDRAMGAPLQRTAVHEDQDVGAGSSGGKAGVRDMRVNEPTDKTEE